MPLISENFLNLSQKSEKVFRDFLTEKGESQVVIACINNSSPFGFASYEFGSDYLRLRDLCVDSRFRKNGIATKLVMEVIGRVRKIGIDEILLFLPSYRAERAKAFYKSLGFYYVWGDGHGPDMMRHIDLAKIIAA